MSSAGMVKIEVPVETITERSLIRFGSLEITAWMPGKMNIDDFHKKEPNEPGINDKSGNVLEWCMLSFSFN